MTKRIVMLLLGMTVLGGCASQSGMYEWGQYEETLFAVYHDPELKNTALKKYRKFVDKSHRPEYPLAPGLFAEAGTFMLEQGDVETALAYYRLEYEAWPESRPMLDVLIRNLEDRQ